MATAKEYRALLVEHRKRQLEVTAENVQRLERTFDAAAASILEKVKGLPDGDEGLLRKQY